MGKPAFPARLPPGSAPDAGGGGCWRGQEGAGGRGSPLRGVLRSGEVRPAAWLGGHQGPEPEAG